jgi:hypothetical protein
MAAWHKPLLDHKITGSSPAKVKVPGLYTYIVDTYLIFVFRLCINLRIMNGQHMVGNFCLSHRLSGIGTHALHLIINSWPSKCALRLHSNFNVHEVYFNTFLKSGYLFIFFVGKRGDPFTSATKKAYVWIWREQTLTRFPL